MTLSEETHPTRSAKSSPDSIPSPPFFCLFSPCQNPRALLPPLYSPSGGAPGGLEGGLGDGRRLRAAAGGGEGGDSPGGPVGKDVGGSEQTNFFSFHSSSNQDTKEITA
uniref:Uncharacterized protein n=1 Tax=Oryza nivara TaxID=4536 RepID=A0A0E0J3Y5_ORYNI